MSERIHGHPLLDLGFLGSGMADTAKLSGGLLAQLGGEH